MTPILQLEEIDSQKKKMVRGEWWQRELTEMNKSSGPVPRGKKIYQLGFDQFARSFDSYEFSF